jgi:hypothetical protein
MPGRPPGVHDLSKNADNRLSSRYTFAAPQQARTSDPAQEVFTSAGDTSSAGTPGFPAPYAAAHGFFVPIFS